MAKAFRSVKDENWIVEYNVGSVSETVVHRRRSRFEDTDQHFGADHSMVETLKTKKISFQSILFGEDRESDH